MNELIKITTNGEGIKTVNARDLHDYLESKQQFANWITSRIKKYGFVEGQDFLITLLKSTGGRPTSEYHITIEMAKELSMVEHNDKGKEARQYFIVMEKKLYEITQTPHDLIESKLKEERLQIDYAIADLKHEIFLMNYGMKQDIKALAEAQQVTTNYINSDARKKHELELQPVKEQIKSIVADYCLHTSTEQQVAYRLVYNKLFDQTGIHFTHDKDISIITAIERYDLENQTYNLITTLEIAKKELGNPMFKKLAEEIIRLKNENENLKNSFASYIPRERTVTRNISGAVN